MAHSAHADFWWAMRASIPRLLRCERSALPTELIALVSLQIIGTLAGCSILEHERNIEVARIEDVVSPFAPNDARRHLGGGGNESRSESDG
ncbi:MAG: hypothetical protein RL643_614 [Actinomycetota bacterium]